MKGVFCSSNVAGNYEIRELDIPTPAADEILIKTIAAAGNPKDWRIIAWKAGWEGVEGSDVAGYVEAVGSDVKDFTKGQRVAAFTPMATHTKYGAFAEYTVAPAHTTFLVGDSVSFESAATLPLAVMTAFLGLFRTLGLQEPPASSKGNAHGVVVVNGAASSVGAFAIQLAKRAGYTVVGIAGNSVEYVKELGADYVIDYRGKSAQDLGEAVKSAVASAGKTIAGTFDAVASESTVEMLAYEVLQPEGGHVTTVNPYMKELKVKNVEAFFTMVGTAHQDPADSAFAKKWYGHASEWLADGSLKANRVRLMPDGLDSVAAGCELLRAEKVHGEKLVYRIQDSKCLRS